MGKLRAEDMLDVKDIEAVDDEIEALGLVVERNELVEVLGSGADRVYKAVCVLVNPATGERYPERFHSAKLGDGQAPKRADRQALPDLPDHRAVLRARREALYWARRRCRRAEVQPAHIRLLQERVRANAPLLGMTRDALADELHEAFGLTTLNDATPLVATCIWRHICERVAAANGETRHEA